MDRQDTIKMNKQSKKITLLIIKLFIINFMIFTWLRCFLLVSYWNWFIVSFDVIRINMLHAIVFIIIIDEIILIRTNEITKFDLTNTIHDQMVRRLIKINNILEDVVKEIPYMEDDENNLFIQKISKKIHDSYYNSLMITILKYGGIWSIGYSINRIL